jgi:hypothetical protein
MIRSSGRYCLTAASFASTLLPSADCSPSFIARRQ